MRMRRCITTLTVALILGSAIFTTAGCGRSESRQPNALSSSGKQIQSPALDTDWAHYFFRPTPGSRYCFKWDEPLEISAGAYVVKTTMSMVSRVRDVTAQGDGVHFDYRVASATKTTNTDPSDADPVIDRSSRRYDYVLANDGTIMAPTQWPSIPGVQTEVRGFVVYPTVAALRSGRGSDSGVTLLMASKDPAAAARMRAETTDGSETLRLKLVVHVAGVSPRPIDTPAGVFSDVIGVEASISSIRALNIESPEVRRAYEGIVQSSAPSSTMWFARDIGLVRVDSTGALIETPSVVLYKTHFPDR